MAKSPFDQLLDSVKAQNVSEEALLQLKALPVRWAWEGCFGVSPAGEVIYVNEKGVITPFEEDFKYATLVYAAQKYPKMQSFLPVRPTDATSCTECGGARRMNAKLGVTGDSILCGICRGLGWRVDSTNDA